MATLCRSSESSCSIAGEADYFEGISRLVKDSGVDRGRERKGQREVGRTPRAGVRVPSTSKRQMVFFKGRSAREGYTLAASAIMGD